MPKRTIKNVDEENTKRIKTENVKNETDAKSINDTKNENKCYPSTSKQTQITDNSKQIETNSTIKQNRKTDYNFWQKINKANDVPNKNTIECIKINQLQEGKIFKKNLQIRLSYKGEIRDTKVGPVFSFHGIDETGEISITIFGKNADTHKSNLQINNVYEIQNFVVYNENPEYPSGTKNTLQIRLNNESIINELDQNLDFSPIKFNFKNIQDVNNMEKNEKTDIVAILLQDYGIETTSNGSIFRDIIVTDNTKEQITATLWSTTAENFSCNKYEVIIIRNGIIVEYQGTKKLNCLSGSLIWCNPKPIEEANSLEKWFKTEISDVPPSNL